MLALNFFMLKFEKCIKAKKEKKMDQPQKERKFLHLLIWFLLFLGLYFTSQYSFLLFHNLAEIFSIVVASGIFMIAWNSRRFIDNNYLLFIGIAYLFIGFLDLIHTLAYKGMEIFRGFDADLPTQLWIASRYLQALSLFVGPLLFKKKLRNWNVFIGYTLITILLLVSIFYLKIFPVCFIEGVGLTPFKKISEYIISLILLSTVALLIKNRKEFDKSVLQWVVCSILFTIGSELAFTFYIDVYEFSNLVGHYLKILSFYLIYKAIIETGLARPYDLLFRNLRQSEERIRESEGRLRSIIETASDAIVTIDAHGRVNLWNSSAEKIFGYSYEEMVERPLSLIMPERYRPFHQKAVEQFVLTNQAALPGKTIEMEGLRKDGGEFPLELSIGKWETKEGIFFTGIIRDITKRKRIEKELQESHRLLEKRVEERTAELLRANELLERVFSSIDLMIAHMDRDFNFIRVNRAYAEADEREPEFYVGKNHFVLFPNEENEAIFRKVVETGEPVFFYEKPFEYTEHPERGVTYWDWSLQPVKEADGKVSEVILSLVNVTSRKKAQEAQKRLNSILEATSDFIGIANPDGKILYLNRAMRNALGVGDEEDLTHLKIADTHPEGTNRLVQEEAIPTAIREGIWSGETTFMSRNGREIPTSQVILAHRSSHGEVEFLSTIARDISEQKEIQRRTQATNCLLNLFAQKTSRKDYLHAVVRLISDWSKCRCVGIRVLDGKRQIPYESHEGFSEAFLKQENWLSIDHDQCACIRVVQGKFDPQDDSVITPAGSFRCNNLAKFFGGLSEKERAQYRGICIEAGFMSVAIIPIRYREEIIGAIHLADEKEQRVPLKMVEFIETMAPLIGEAIHRFNLESDLYRNYETQKAINSLLRLSLENIPLEEFLEGTLDMIISNSMISPEARVCIFLTEPHNEVLAMKAQYGLPDSIRKKCARIPFGGCLCGRMALTKKIQYTSDLNDHHEFIHEDISPHSHYHVPILYGNRLLGMITLYLKEGDRPSQEREAFLTAVANTLASIILRREWEEALCESESRLRLLSAQLITVQENERKQIARDLHDGVGQMLSAIKFKIEEILQQRDERKQMIEDANMRYLVPMIRESIEEVRRIQMDLRPPVLDDLGIIATIGWFVREFERVYSFLSIQKVIHIEENEIPVSLKIVLYRILQEALNNIAKHSQANRATIALGERDKRIELTIEDNGTGFDLKNMRKGLGLTSMRERAELSGGTFMIESVLGKGTTIRASWPL